MHNATAQAYILVSYMPPTLQQHLLLNDLLSEIFASKCLQLTRPLLNVLFEL